MSGFGYNVLGFGANASSAAGGASDDEFNRVSFLSHFDGTNNGVNSTFDDGSDSNHTITTNGDVTQGSFNPYGTNWAVDFSKDDNPRLSCGSSSDFTFGTGDFTVEFFVFFYSLTSYQTPMSAGYSNDSGGMFIQTGNGDGKFQFRSGGSALVSETTSDDEANKWYHIAFSRQSGTLRVYRNGVQTGTASNSTNLNRVGNILIGSDQDFNIDGLLSNFRLVKGTSLYNSNFTPPASALTAVTNTTLLTLQSNRFVDNSASGHTVTPNTGKETIGSFGPFLTDAVYDPAVNGASAYFDGSGDALRVSDTASLRIGTGQYTIECWFWFDVLTSNNSGIFAKRDSSSDYWRILATSSGVNFRINSDVVSDSTVVNKKCWNHIAITRDSNNDNRIYVNGSLINTISSSVNISNTGTVRLGEFQADAGPMTGYICDARIVIGTAVYTGSSLTLPTAPLTAITNTKLLLNMADGQAIDSAAQNNLMLYGTAKTSTVQKKFGTASLLLDGNSDYAEIPSAAGDFGSGDWTIECSIRLVGNVSSRDVFIAKWEKSGNKRGYRLAVINSSGNKIELKTSSNGSGGTAIGTTVFATNLNSYTWYNIALVNSSGTVKLYVNGTADSTTHSLASGAPYQNPGIVFLLGASVPSDPELFFNGYIDEVRLSKFARYTSNYTSPTEPFADKGQ